MLFSLLGCANWRSSSTLFKNTLNTNSNLQAVDCPMVVNVTDYGGPAAVMRQCHLNQTHLQNKVKAMWMGV